MDIYTVTRLNREVRSLIEANLSTVWVRGEISNLARPRSGHIYFSLKDEDSQVRCALFRMQGMRLAFAPEDGMEVLAHARPGLYLPRGDFQLIVEHLEQAGEGALRRAFEVLKKKLADQGLFDAAHKKPLPVIPNRIGVITSPSGAAIRDILAVLQRRFPGIPVLIYPVPVQGTEAAPAIARALDVADERRECDVLILARGGGSLEDLWAFNEEIVAHAIHRCAIPIISAIGHEIDVTIADFVADRRAPTPSAAAELVVPDRWEYQRRFDALDHRLLSLMRHHLREQHQALAWLERRLIHPRRRLSDDTQRLDDLMGRLIRCTHTFAAPRRNRLARSMAELYRHDPSARLRVHGAHRRQLAQRLSLAARRYLGEHGSRIASLGRALDAINPRQTLERGYAIVTRQSDGAIVRGPEAVSEGQLLRVRLAKGTLLCSVLRAGAEEAEERQR
uniref:Exodeoxyribonuclease 7 large subunit n=1 Tax=Candidatus Kentrum sp. DK TaxID=2126562 RepID=A0A450SZ07_9GAMM|nr:MAG: Exodeoxyribonuclease VII large subunit [Candidatus Kentron sp. DK]VFJ59376.1 MAG: Exodeoxyribonuclease VII large subunit [Candidatus Kentron sp. DK]